LAKDDIRLSTLYGLVHLGTDDIQCPSTLYGFVHLGTDDIVQHLSTLYGLVHLGTDDIHAHEECLVHLGTDDEQAENHLTIFTICISDLEHTDNILSQVCQHAGPGN
jgi:hypothetical protein